MEKAKKKMATRFKEKYEKEINPLLHYILKVEHPVAASHANRQWNHQNMFKWVNNIIRNNNGESECIRWTRNKVWQDTEKPGRKWDESKLKSAKELGLPEEFDVPF